VGVPEAAEVAGEVTVLGKASAVACPVRCACAALVPVFGLDGSGLYA
jgi:hypothetical protein